jgi:hypothetical protein
VLARAPYKHPSVFVGCPYTPDTYFKSLRAALDRIPIEFHFANSSITSKHVLDRIRSGIVKTDFSLFDITNWNANVTLEVGLAEGLNRDYYILFRPGKGAKAEPPADLKGLQRFQYKRHDGFANDTLSFQLIEKYIALARELGHFPTVDELRLKARREPGFPNDKTFSRWGGSKQQLAGKIRDYCKEHRGYDDILNLCADIPNTSAAPPSSGIERRRKLRICLSNQVGSLLQDRLH